MATIVTIELRFRQQVAAEGLEMSKMHFFRTHRAHVPAASVQF
jgi:hypothetical protein